MQFNFPAVSVRASALLPVNFVKVSEPKNKRSVIALRTALMCCVESSVVAVLIVVER